MKREQPSHPTGAPLAVTMGDPSGIGPELALKAWSELRAGGEPFFVIGDVEHLRRIAAQCGIGAEIVAIASADGARRVFPEALPVLPVDAPVTGEAGKSSPEDARATIRAIEMAVELIAHGEASALVTNPITKDSLYRAGFKHPGHTEFLAELAHRHFGANVRSVMMLWCEDLAVIPVTIHVSLLDAIKLLNTEVIVETALIAAKDLREKFGVAKPRLAISGLNPHAGENGAMGTEDRDIIAPAVEKLRSLGISVRGPLPADTMFHAGARRTYDAAICMYHDQALIPIKTIAFDSGVNVTLGLPFIRTSPDHGTAYDIAGKGIARADSLIAALRLAGRLASTATSAAA